MYTLKTVTTKKESRHFTKFPNDLYNDVKPYTTTLSLDEEFNFNPQKNPVLEYCDTIRFLVYDNKKVVGRIAGIINRKWNEEFNGKTARFSRIDMIDDIEVTKLLIDSVTKWAKEKGMDTLIGPIGFTDLDRQGMLVDGFEEMNMFITIYNHPYYKEHLEKLGFIKDADWIEKRITVPGEVPDKVKRGAEIARRRFGFKLQKIKKRKEISKYVYEAFDMYNIAFKNLYGFLALPKDVIDYYVSMFITMVRLDYLWFVLDKDDKVASFALVMPSLSRSMKLSKGKLFPFGWYRILKDFRTNEVVDLWFIAVDPKYQGQGLVALFWEDAIKLFNKKGVKFAETGPELENNAHMVNMWKDYDHRTHKRRRCYTKKI